METTIIAPDNTMALMAVTLGWVAFSIYAEQTWAWAGKVSGVIVALVGAMVLSNMRVIPTSAVWFDDIVWGYVVPLAIPLLLLQCNMQKIWRQAGRLLTIYLIGAVGTVISAVVAFALLGDAIPSGAGVSAMMTGSYIGGSVNLAGLSQTFAVPSDVVAATIVADNLLMALYFFWLIAMAGMKLFQTHYPHPYIDQQTTQAQPNTAATYWKKTPVSLLDIGVNLAVSAVIVALSMAVANWIGQTFATTGVAGFWMGLLSNSYIWITTLSMLLATFGAKQVEQLGGSQEIGTFLIYIFFFTIGVPASVGMIVENSPLLLVFCGIMVAGNLLITLVFGKLLGFSLEEMILASNANIGGPTTAAAMAISQGWQSLVAPVMLIGTLGYVLGTYAGTAIGFFLM